MEPDLDQWLTKAEVTKLTGMSEKTIERRVNEGKIRRDYRLIPGRKPLPVLHPDDVKTVSQKVLKPTPMPRQSRAEQSAVMSPPRELTASSRQTATALTAAVTALTERLAHTEGQASILPAQELTETFRHVVGELTASLTALTEQLATAQKDYLTLHEAARMSGLPKEYLRRLARSGGIRAVRLGGWRIRREDLAKHDAVSSGPTASA
jgi:excisionase family DNA binding protein